MSKTKLQETVAYSVRNCKLLFLRTKYSEVTMKRGYTSTHKFYVDRDLTGAVVCVR